MAEDAIEGGAENARQEAIIDNLAPLENGRRRTRGHGIRRRHRRRRPGGPVRRHPPETARGERRQGHHCRRAGKGGRGRRPHPVGRGDRSQGAERAVPRLEGTWRAAGDAGDQGPVPAAGAARVGAPAHAVAAPFMHNHGCYIASLGNVARWLGEQAGRWASRSIPAWPPAMSSGKKKQDG